MVIGRRSLLLAGAAIPVSAYGQCITDRFAVDACRGGVRNTASLPPGASLDLSFMTPGTLDPLLTFARASTATYFDATGTMQTAAINAPRWDYDPVTHALRGLLLEDQRTNGVRNSTGQGAVVGTPGTMPTNWSLGLGATTLSQQIVGTGTEGGIAYVDFRVFGTVATNATIALVPEANNVISGTNGQAFTTSLYWSLVGGSFNGVTLIQSAIRELTSGGALVKDNLLAFATPAAGALASQRTLASIALNGGGTTAFAQPRYNFTVSNGAAVDFTIRIGGTQFEGGAFATSYIPTTTAAVTRSIDSCLVPSASMAWFTSPGGSWFAEFSCSVPAPPNACVVGQAGSVAGGGITPLYCNSAFGLSQFDGVNSVGTTLFTALNTVAKGATTWAPGQARITMNAAPVRLSANLTAGYGALATSGLAFLVVATQGTIVRMTGYIRRVAYWPRILTDAEMQQVTT